MVFALDRSGGISAADFQNMVTVIQGVIDALPLDTGADPASYRVGVMSFNGTQEVHKQLIVPGSSFGSVPNPGGATDIAAALK